MKKNLLKRMLGLGMAIALLAVSHGGMNVQAKENDSEEVYVIKIANSNTPFTNINGQEVLDAVNAGCYSFKNYVEQNSEGRIKVEIYDSGVLGGSSEGLSQCMQNVVQACVTGDGELSTLYPKLQVLCVPYLFNNRIEFYNTLDSVWMANLFADMRTELGIRLLASSDNGGFRSISNNTREIQTASDLKGLKIRSMEIPAYTTMLESMGATATPIAWAELYTSLQTGVVDGQENPPANVLNGSLQEVQKYYTLDQHSISSLVLMLNEDFYQTLPEDLKQVVTMGGIVAQESMRGANCANEELALQGLKDSGMNIYIPTKEEKATFQDASQEPVLKWLKGEVGDEYVSGFMTAVEEAKEGKGILGASGGEAVAVSQQASSGNALDTRLAVACIVAGFAVLFAVFTLVRGRKREDLL